MKKIQLVILAVLSSVILLNSCLNNNNNTTQPQSAAFLLHKFRQLLRKLGVYVNNGLFDTMHFGVYTPYVTNVSPGTYTFMVDSFGSSTPALTSNITIEVRKITVIL